MFESVRLVNAKLVLKLKPVMDERNTNVLDRLSRYIRVRIPQIAEIHALHRDGMDIY